MSANALSPPDRFKIAATYTRTYLAFILECNHPVLATIDIALQHLRTTTHCGFCDICIFYNNASTRSCERTIAMFKMYEKTLIDKFTQFGWISTYVEITRLTCNEQKIFCRIEEFPCPNFQIESPTALFV